MDIVNVEQVIKNVEDRYTSLLNYFVKLKDQTSIKEDEAEECIKKVASFQRFLEQTTEELLLYQNNTYFPRVKSELHEVINKLTTRIVIYSESVDSDRYIPGVRRVDNYNYYDEYEGILPESKQLLERTTLGYKEAPLRSLNAMIRILKVELHPTLLELYEDLHLIGNLTTISADVRLDIQNQLMGCSFDKVATYLNDAEARLLESPPKYKDCLSNCRHALEQLLEDITKAEGVQTQQRFNIDILEFSKKKPDLLDEANAKYIQGIYHYISLKGSHPYSDINQATKEAEFGLTQTFTAVSRFLDSYLTQKKQSSRQAKTI